MKTHGYDPTFEDFQSTVTAPLIVAANNQIIFFGPSGAAST